MHYVYYIQTHKIVFQSITEHPCDSDTTHRQPPQNTRMRLLDPHEHNN